MKLLSIGAMVAALSAAAFAYNPPAGGDRMDQLTGATALTNAGSNVGGGIFLSAPQSVLYNPAVVADEQRITIGAGGSFIVAPNDAVNSVGSAFDAGVILPWKWFVGTILARGNFAQFERFGTGNSLGVTVGAAKEVTGRLKVGITLSAGTLWGAGSDWLLDAGLGVLYRQPQLGYFKDFRVGVSFLYLGKTYTNTKIPGAFRNDWSDMFPGIGTLRGGVGALFLDTRQVTGGASVDLSFPSFQNMIIDVGVQFEFIKSVYLGISESINVRELARDRVDLIPAVTIGYKFLLHGNKNRTDDKGWQDSEMRVDLGWKTLYDSAHAVSASALLNLGARDNEPPVIELWGGTR